MDAHRTSVFAALAAKTMAETPKNACWEAMLVRSPVPQLRHQAPRLVASLGCGVEPLEHARVAVQSARIVE